jgi:hypothetical protein
VVNRAHSKLTSKRHQSQELGWLTSDKGSAEDFALFSNSLVQGSAKRRRFLAAIFPDSVKLRYR